MLYAIYCLKEIGFVFTNKQPCMPNSVATLQSAGNDQGPPPPPPPMSNGEMAEKNLFHDMQPVIRKANKVNNGELEIKDYRDPAGN